jgi:DNA mismatch repair ATPase MutS
MKTHDNIINKHMKIRIHEDKYQFDYTYKLGTGISQIKGGFKVLKDLQYPQELLDSIEEISKEIG